MHHDWRPLGEERGVRKTPQRLDEPGPVDGRDIAVELGYVDLGAAEYRSSGTVNPPGPIAVAPATANIDVESKGFTLRGIGSPGRSTAGRLLYWPPRPDEAVSGGARFPSPVGQR
jgi:hypothetical protein